MSYSSLSGSNMSLGTNCLHYLCDIFLTCFAPFSRVHELLQLKLYFLLDLINLIIFVV